MPAQGEAHFWARVRSQECRSVRLPAASPALQLGRSQDLFALGGVCEHENGEVIDAPCERWDAAQQQWAADNLRLEVYLRDRQSGLPLLPELDLLTWLLPEGTLLHRYPNNEYLLEESLTVTVRVKK